MLSFFIPTILALLNLTHALPTTKSKRQSDSSTEQWTIPRLDMHMMSMNTGLPGNSWPPSAYFNTTISFDVLIPQHTLPSDSTTPPTNPNTTTTITTTCTASFPNGTLPLSRTYCTPPSATEVLFFEMHPYTDLGPRRAELSFYLELTSAIGWDEENETAKVAWWGGRPVTANDPSEKSSFLTCLEGAPLDGLRCRIKSYLSVREELVVGVDRIWGGEGDEEVVVGEGEEERK